MKVKLQFRNISGQIFHGSFSGKTKVQDICNFLNDKLNSKNNIIYLISTKPKQLFYKNDDDIKSILKPKKKDIFFLTLNNDKLFQQKQIVAPPSSAMNAYKNFTEIRNIGLANRCTYAEYAKIVKDVPKDIDCRVKQLVQFGYDVEDCREALRDAYYNVHRAADILIQRNRNRSDEDGVDNLYSTNPMLDILRFMFQNREILDSNDYSSDDDYSDFNNDDDDNDSNSIHDDNDSNSSHGDNDSNSIHDNNSDDQEINPNINRGIRNPVPRLPPSPSSPRSSINRQRNMNSNAANQERQNQNLLSRNPRQRVRPAIVNQRASLITRPNVGSNQRSIPKNPQSRQSNQ